MSLTAIRRETEVALLQIEDRLLAAWAKFADGTARDKVAAAGEIEFLKRQKRDLERRLAELDRLQGGRWENVRQWLKEESAVLGRWFDEWIVHH